MGRDLLRAEHMTVGYGNVPLLSEVELHVRQGEIVTLIGPNGAGKSTILKSIAGQLLTRHELRPYIPRCQNAHLPRRLYG